MINEFKYRQTWKIWPSPLSLSLYSTFKLLKPYGNITPSEGPDKILCPSAWYNSTAGKCVPLQTAKSQNRGQIERPRKTLHFTDKLWGFTTGFMNIFIHKDLFFQLDIELATFENHKIKYSKSTDRKKYISAELRWSVMMTSKVLTTAEQKQFSFGQSPMSGAISSAA